MVDAIEAMGSRLRGVDAIVDSDELTARLAELQRQEQPTDRTNRARRALDRLPAPVRDRLRSAREAVAASRSGRQ